MKNIVSNYTTRSMTRNLGQKPLITWGRRLSYKQYSPKNCKENEENKNEKSYSPLVISQKRTYSRMAAKAHWTK